MDKRYLAKVAANFVAGVAEGALIVLGAKAACKIAKPEYAAVAILLTGYVGGIIFEKTDEATIKAVDNAVDKTFDKIEDRKEEKKFKKLLED